MPSKFLNRAVAIATGTPTYWLATGLDSSMAEHPDSLNAALYQDFRIVSEQRQPKAEVQTTPVEIRGYSLMALDAPPNVLAQPIAFDAVTP